MLRYRTLLQGFALSLSIASVTAPPVFAQAAATAPATPPAPKTDTLPSAKSILDRHVEAIGGRAALKAVSSIHVKGSLSVPSNGMTGTIEVFAARPNKEVAKMNIGGIGESVEGFDGTVAWSTSPMTGPMLATGEELEQKKTDAEFDEDLDVASRYVSLETVEKTEFEGRPVYKVAMTRKDGGVDIGYFDVETGLKAGATVDRKNPMGTITMTTAISGYKKFGDVLQPTVSKMTVSGVQLIATFTSIEYNSVDPSVFELPAEIKALVK
jgi:hypothetical protein